MLKRIEIENFLTIERCVIEPLASITAIIGESGSGKSLILKAIDVVFSQKTDTSIVGNFADITKINLHFSLNRGQMEILKDLGITEDEVVFTKLIKKGTSKVLVNHEPISTKVVSTLKKMFLSIVSQDYRFEIFSPEKMLEVIDTQVDRDVKEKFSNIFRKYSDIKREMEYTGEKLRQIEKEHPEILLETIEKANPKRGEYEELLDTLNRIKNFKVIKDIAEKAIFELYEKENSCEDILSRLESDLQKVKGMSLSTKVDRYLAEALSSVRAAKDELYGLAIRSYSDGEIDKINSRLFELEKLQRQFGKNIDEIIEQKKILERMIDEKERLMESLDMLKEEVKVVERTLLEEAEILSQERKKVANSIINRISSYLSKLNLENSIFEIAFRRKQLTKLGVDSIDILFSANPDLKPDSIDKVASGGEKSRFILSLKMVLSELSKSEETVIFDEIESGLSSNALEKLMSSLKEYSENNQIILITHSEKMLSIADRVYRVRKEFLGDRTTSYVEKLD